MPYLTYVIYALEVVGQTIFYQKGEDLEALYAVSAQEACKVLQTLPFSQIVGVSDGDLEQKCAEYKTRLTREINIRWPAFLLDARAGEI